MSCGLCPLWLARPSLVPMAEESWSDAIRAYKHTKVAPPWATEGVAKPEPVKYVTHYQKTREAREFDPVLGVYRDDRKERSVKDTEHRTRIVSTNRARDKQVHQVQSYNIVNHRPIFEEPEPKPDKPARIDTRAKYNIVSNLDFSDHHHAKPGERPTEKAPPQKPMKNYVSHTFSHRPYDILNNKYHRNHGAKDAVDKELARRAAADRFWQTRDFNPLTGTYYDKAKEVEFRDTRKVKEKEHVEKAGRTLPPSTKGSEGMGYDILNHTTKNEATLKKLEETMHKPQLTRVRHEVDKHLMEKGVDGVALGDRRAENRIAAARFEDKRGHDIITNRRAAGIGAKPVYAAKAGSKKSGVWSKVEQAETRTRRTMSAGGSPVPAPAKARPASGSRLDEGGPAIRTGGFRR